MVGARRGAGRHRATWIVESLKIAAAPEIAVPREKESDLSSTESRRSATDSAALILRLTLGPMMAVHGLNKVFGPDGLEGTTRYFEFLGLRPANVHARVAATTEIGTGVLLTLGAATPLASAGVIGIMASSSSRGAGSTWVLSAPPRPHCPPSDLAASRWTVCVEQPAEASDRHCSPPRWVSPPQSGCSSSAGSRPRPTVRWRPTRCRARTAPPGHDTGCTSSCARAARVSRTVAGSGADHPTVVGIHERSCLAGQLEQSEHRPRMAKCFGSMVNPNWFLAERARPRNIASGASIMVPQSAQMKWAWAWLASR